MQRITITIDDGLLAELDRMIALRNYPNRSEALRDLARAGLREAALQAGAAGRCFGVLSYVYDHEARNLSTRLTAMHHQAHDLTVSSLHVHIDSGRCLEVSILRGDAAALRTFADGVISQKFLEHGALTIIPARPHAGRPHGHDHSHDHAPAPRGTSAARDR
ncbi:nickel-responsive transcriptional regulator NikR [Camelimonas abortus]|uniref:Putative nickel-responsive regulator n=1 Tax=Camelimonas abortus TaxID=1017184 RepID=A0ABV7LG29_9HYPH